MQTGFRKIISVPLSASQSERLMKTTSSDSSSSWPFFTILVVYRNIRSKELSSSFMKVEAQKKLQSLQLGINVPGHVHSCQKLTSVSLEVTLALAASFRSSSSIKSVEGHRFVGTTLQKPIALALRLVTRRQLSSFLAAHLHA